MKIHPGSIKKKKSENAQKFADLVNLVSKSNERLEIKNIRIDKLLTSYSEYLVKNNLMVVLLELHILIISILHNEIIHENTNFANQNYLLYFIMILTVMLIIIILLGFFIQRKKEYLLKILYPNLNVKSSSLFILLFKIIICFIVPNPFLNIEGLNYFDMYSEVYEMEFRYYYNDILTVLMVFRFVIVLPALLGLSFMGTPVYTRLIFIHEIEQTLLFQIKYYLEKYTLKIAVFLFFFLIICFTLVIRILERPNPFRDFSNFYNAFYFATVTVATVGYGDYVPKTSLGQLATTFFMLLGIVNLNLVNYSMMNFLEFSLAETRSLYNFQKSELKKIIRIKYLDFFYYLKRINYFIKHQNDLFVRMLSNYYLVKLSSSYRDFHNYYTQYDNINVFNGNYEEFCLKKELELHYNLIIQETTKIDTNLSTLNKGFARYKKFGYFDN